ncbi:hypothetical protein L2E82_18055 [Cichorium intybus]|uniref:Uncharacterized protein n=1 Tax=Cichorium intybus TaxID=13427 RepID=A0ACB9FA91_CICIN|nr:hypothetical protein L2E82_18055 [Cichorium intybus]
MEHLERWLVQEGYEANELTYTCRAVEAVFRMEEPVYSEEEFETEGFELFHRRANYAPNDSFSYADYWATISST